MWDSPRERPEHFTLNPYAPLHEGLAALYGGGEGCAKSLRYADSSLFGNHGTLTNMDPPTDWLWVPELGRWVCDFVTNDYIGYTGVDLAGVSALSVSIWMKSNTAAGGLIGAWSSGGQYLHYTGGQNFAVGKVGIGNGFKYVSAASAPTTDIWHSVIGTYDGSNLRIYHDGILKNTNSSAATTIPPIAGLDRSIGRYDAEIYFNGQLADGMIWNRCLTASEIAQEADPAWSVMKGGLILAPRRRIFPAAAVGVSRPAHVIGGGIAA